MGLNSDSSFRPPTYVGVDNGVTGTIAVLYGDKTSLQHMPTKSEQSYTKARQTITRVDFEEFLRILTDLNLDIGDKVLVLLERPMVNPMRFKASASALRCLEAVLIAVERCSYPFQYVDSKEWQKVMLPQGTEKEDLKRVSLEMGKRLFPGIGWRGFKDSDSLLMAEWARRKGL